MDACNCDVFIGVGCLDDNPQASNVPNLESLPVEGYVYLDSVRLAIPCGACLCLDATMSEDSARVQVPVNMKPCLGLADLKRVCTQVSRDITLDIRASSVPTCIDLLCLTLPFPVLSARQSMRTEVRKRGPFLSRMKGLVADRTSEDQ
jgi:hypothetical protein